MRFRYKDIVGTYVRTPEQNGWHRITVTACDESGKKRSKPTSFRWTNGAKVSWTLHVPTAAAASDNGDSSGEVFLEVGSDCPYNRNGTGHVKCHVVRSSSSSLSSSLSPMAVVALLGPFGERYDRVVVPPRVVVLPSWNAEADDEDRDDDDQVATGVRLEEASPRSRSLTRTRTRRTAILLPIVQPNDDDHDDYDGDGGRNNRSDLTYLAAIAASAAMNATAIVEDEKDYDSGSGGAVVNDIFGRSAVVAIRDARRTHDDHDDDDDDDMDVVADFFSTYRPSEIDVFESDRIRFDLSALEKQNTGRDKTVVRYHGAIYDDGGGRERSYRASDLGFATCALAKVAFLDNRLLVAGTAAAAGDGAAAAAAAATVDAAAATKVVVAAPVDDYGAALLASSVAARVGAPLFYVSSHQNDQDEDEEEEEGLRDGMENKEDKKTRRYRWIDMEVVAPTLKLLGPSEILFIGEGMATLNETGDCDNGDNMSSLLNVLINDDDDDNNCNGVTLPKGIVLPVFADVVEWISCSRGLEISYLAVVNPLDRMVTMPTTDTPFICPSAKISLTGPAYSARRSGLVLPLKGVPLGNDGSAASGAADMKIGGGNGEKNGRNGTLKIGETSSDPVVFRSALDQVRDAISTCRRRTNTSPDHVALLGGFDVVPTLRTANGGCGGNKNDYAVTDAPYGQRGGYDARGGGSDDDGGGCGVGVGGRRWKFRDWAIGRIYAESICCSSLLAARTVNYELLVDGRWGGNVVESGSWGYPEITTLFRLAGVTVGDDEGGNDQDDDDDDKKKNGGSCDGDDHGHRRRRRHHRRRHCLRHLVKTDLESTRKVEACAFLHKDHSGPGNLGNSCARETKALYSPSVVSSRGCSCAGIDRCDRARTPPPAGRGNKDGGGKKKGAERVCASYSVAGRMLGRGCVAYVGSPRISTAPGTLTDVAFFHELLYGEVVDATAAADATAMSTTTMTTTMMTVGLAMRAAYNKAVVHHLDGGRMPPYSLENQVLLGDPGLVPCFAGAGLRHLAMSSSSSSSSSSNGSQSSAVVDSVVVPAGTTASSSSRGPGRGGIIVTVAGPSGWALAPIKREQLRAWRHEGELHTRVAPLVEQETAWCNRDGGYDRQELYHVASVTLFPSLSLSSLNVRAVVPLDAVEIAWTEVDGDVGGEEGGGGRERGRKAVVLTDDRDGGISSLSWVARRWPSGKHYVQRHADGSMTVRWRLHMLDYDMRSGGVKSELKLARFMLVLDE